MQILVFVAVIAGPVIGNIAKKVKEQAERRRLEAERERRKIEAIRRGRPVEEPVRPTRAETEAAAKRAKLEALQQRRRAQIEELRRRMREGQAGQRPASSRQQPPGATRPLPQRPPAQRAQSAGRSISQAELERRRAALRAKREQYERAKALAAAQAQQVEQAKKERARKGSAPPRAVAPRRAAPPPASVAIEPAALAASLHDPASIRRAIVLNEILSPPIALRENHMQDFV